MAGGKRIFFGYFTVAALVLTSFIPLSLGLSCAGIFYPAVSADLGIGTGLLGYYTSILWLAAMVTLPVMGRLLERRDARLCVGGAVVVIAVAFVWLSFTQLLWQFYAGVVGVVLLFVGGGSAVLLYVAAFVYGCFYGITNVMTPIITRRAFGDAEYPVIYSRVSMAASIGSVVSGFIWGASIEATGGYALMFVGVIVVMALTAVAVLAIGSLSRKEQR